MQGRRWLEVLGEHTCWRLLGLERVGRLAYLRAGEPEIVPMNYAVDHQTIVIRTDVGAKVAALGRNHRVAFEIDHSDEGSETGWSVLVRGRATVIENGPERAHLEQLELRTWPVGRRDVWIRIEPESVTGRAIHRGPEDPTCEGAVGP